MEYTINNSNIKSFNFNESEHLAETIRQADIDILQMEKGRFSANIHLIDFQNVDLQMGEIYGPQILEQGSSSKKYYSFLYDLNYTKPTITDGFKIDKYSYTFYPPNCDHFSRGSGFSNWVYLCFKKNQQINQLIEEIFNPMLSRHLVCKNKIFFNNIRNLFKKLLYLAKRKPNYFNDTNTLDLLEAEIIDAQISLLLHSNIKKENVVHLSEYKKIVGKFYDISNSKIDRNLTIIDISKELGVSLRTLYNAFEKICKISPYRYIKILRLNRAHKQILSSNSKIDTISNIAISNGFNHLGRFSSEYRNIFRFSPSKILKK